eukprot:493986-Amphidinium_carterae.1
MDKASAQRAGDFRFETFWSHFGHILVKQTSSFCSRHPHKFARCSAQHFLAQASPPWHPHFPSVVINAKVNNAWLHKSKG